MSSDFKKTKEIINFLIRHRDEPIVCRDFFYFAKETLNISVDNFLDDSTIGSWQSFSEYFLFDRDLYPQNYPRPELDMEDIRILQDFIEG